MKRQADADAVRLRFFLPPEELRPFVTTIYQMDVISNANGPVEDRLHPEWANLRFVVHGEMEAAVGDEPMQTIPSAVLAGPSSRTTRFRARSAQIWGIGLLPLGWSRLVDLPAEDFADRFVDLGAGRLGHRYAPLQRCFEGGSRVPNEVKSRLFAALTSMLGPPQARDADIVALEHALIDPSIHTVGDLAEASGMSLRSLERLSKMAFGFPPQLLLRRQRFLRSLAQFMLDPSLKWIDTLDSHYHDQAHFVRDFKRFMGMSPSAYAKLPHPVLGAAAHARKAIAGEAVQVLHRPPDA